MARAGRALTLLVLLGATLLLVGCAGAERAFEDRALSIHGDRVLSVRVNDGEGQAMRPEVVIELKGADAPALPQMCAMLGAVAERSREETVGVTYVMTQPDGTSRLVILSWSPITRELIRWEGDSPEPHGEGLGTSFPVSHATGVTAEELAEAGRGTEITMTPWPEAAPGAP